MNNKSLESFSFDTNIKNMILTLRSELSGAGFIQQASPVEQLQQISSASQMFGVESTTMCKF